MMLKVSVFFHMPSRGYSMSRLLEKTSVGFKHDGKVIPLTGNIDQCVSIAVEHIQRGSIIALPTDTIYGLAGNAQSTEAIKKLYHIKNRDFSKPIAICVSDISKIKRWGVVGHLPEELLHELLPGPVTIVVNRTKLLNSELNPGVTKVGIRIPNNLFIRKLTSALDIPLALTSANESNKTSTVAVKEFSSLWNKLGAIFDGGRIGDNRAGSTIVDLSIPETYEIIRKGLECETTVQILHKFGYKTS